MRRGRYYLGRVIKLGTLDKEKLINAIAESVTISVGKSRWTITNVVDRRQEEPPFLFAKLAKFSHDGHVTVVDTLTKSEIEALAPNLLIASTPFVYLPQYSGIAYMHRPVAPSPRLHHHAPPARHHHPGGQGLAPEYHPDHQPP